MFKKGLFVLVAVALVLTSVMVPMASSAEDISGALYFNVDFKDGSVQDSTGNFTLDEDNSIDVSDGSEDFSIATDETLGRKVGVFDAWGPLKYSSVSGETLAGYDLSQGLTLEVYVNLTALQANMVFIEAAGGALHLQQYNDGNDASVGLRCGDVTKSGEGGDGGDAGYSMRNAYQESVLPDSQWFHLVGTSDGNVNYFYVNGQLAASVERAGSVLKTPNNGTDSNVYVGESFYGGMWGATGFAGKMAFARIYKAYADAETVSTLYSNATGNVAPAGPTADPAAPTAEPTAEPSATDDGGSTATPTEAPNNSDTSNNGNASNSGTSTTGGKTANTTTFDLGIVSLAAVALSSVVAAKKRKG